MRRKLTRIANILLLIPLYLRKKISIFTNIFYFGSPFLKYSHKLWYCSKTQRYVGGIEEETGFASWRYRHRCLHPTRRTRSCMVPIQGHKRLHVRTACLKKGSDHVYTEVFIVRNSKVASSITSLKLNFNSPLPDYLKQYWKPSICWNESYNGLVSESIRHIRQRESRLSRLKQK